MMAFQSFVLVYVKNYFEFEIRNLCSPIPCNQLCQRSPIKLLIPRLLSYRYIVAFRESMHLKWNHSIFHFFFSPQVALIPICWKSRGLKHMINILRKISGEEDKHTKISFYSTHLRIMTRSYEYL